MIDKKLMEENERMKAEIDFLKKSQSLAKKLEELTTKEKVKVVNELRTKYELKVLLEMTNIPLSVYYYQLNAIKNEVNKYEDIEKEIDYLYLEKHKKRVGYQRIYRELKNQGIKIGKNKVLEIMRKKGYVKQNKINYRRYNSYKGDLGGLKENLLNQDFKATKPYEKAGTDAKLEKVLNMIKKLKINHQDRVKGMIIQSMSRKGNCLDNSPTENLSL